MPPPIELLYRLTPRDAQSAYWGSIYMDLLTQANSVLVETDLDEFVQRIPPGYVLWVTNVIGRAVTAAAANVRSVAVVVTDPSGNIIGSIAWAEQIGAPFTPTRLVVQNPCNVLIDPFYHRLQCEAEYTALGATNTARLLVSGFITPRANIAAF